MNSRLHGGMWMEPKPPAPFLCSGPEVLHFGAHKSHWKILKPQTDPSVPPQRPIPQGWGSAQTLKRTGLLCFDFTPPDTATCPTCLAEVTPWYWVVDARNSSFTFFQKAAYGQSHPLGNYIWMAPAFVQFLEGISLMHTPHQHGFTHTHLAGSHLVLRNPHGIGGMAHFSIKKLLWEG